MIDIIERPLRDLPLAVVDFETTGLSPKGCRVCEVAVVRVDPGQPPRIVLDTLVDPEGPVHCSRIHGIEDEDVVGAPIFSDLLGDIVLATEGAVVGAFNASFDMNFLQAEIERKSGRLRAPPPHICFRYVRPIFGVGEACSLKSACSELGIGGTSHRAAEDAYACALMWHHYLQGAETVGISTLADLAKCGTNKYLRSLYGTAYGPKDFEAVGGRRSATALKPRMDDLELPTVGPPVRRASTTMQRARGDWSRRRTYWHALVDALKDNQLDEREHTELRQIAADIELRPEEMRAVHAQLLANRLSDYASDDNMDAQEVAAIRSLMISLGALGWTPGMEFA
jgi:DNA polymerase-3 subunit epsilon